jgi:hypothetical protein
LATRVAASKLVDVLGPEGESSKIGVGDRRRFLVLLATLFGEEVPVSLSEGSESMETLMGFLLFLILNAADIVLKGF